MTPLLEIRDLRVEFGFGGAPVLAVQGVSFSLGRGETLALVGESGCGKSATALAIVRLLEASGGAGGGRIAGGRVLFEGRDVGAMSGPELRSLRGGRIGFVFQEPMSAFNPVHRIGTQVAEPIRLHRGLGRRAAHEEAIAWLGRVALPDPRGVADAWPHELSGGMLQRALIAAALAGGPSLLIADEPTTALDATTQAQILDLLADLRRELGLALLFVTHDLAVVARIAGRVAVLYSGKIVEEGPAAELFRAPRHPYTRGLLRAIPRIDSKPEPAGNGSGRPRGAVRARLATIPGHVPDPARRPGGCAFHPRCEDALLRSPEARPGCAIDDPALFAPAGAPADVRVACHLHEPAPGGAR